VLMLPALAPNGLLPPGIHNAPWEDFVSRFSTTPYRRRLIAGLKRALDALRVAGCQSVYVDGSFVTAKEIPGDFDCCWDTVGVDPVTLHLIDPVFFDFSNKRAAQKAVYGGEFFPAQGREGTTGKTWLEFFQTDKDTGGAKGIIAIDLRTLTP
jgi:hypothetical protein